MASLESEGGGESELKITYGCVSGKQRKYNNMYNYARE